MKYWHNKIIFICNFMQWTLFVLYGYYKYNSATLKQWIILEGK